MRVIHKRRFASAPSAVALGGLSVVRFRFLGLEENLKRSVRREADVRENQNLCQQKTKAGNPELLPVPACASLNSFGDRWRTGVLARPARKDSNCSARCWMPMSRSRYLRRW